MKVVMKSAALTSQFINQTSYLFALLPFPGLQDPVISIVSRSNNYDSGNGKSANLEIRGSAISKTVALILLIILIQNHCNFDTKLLIQNY